MRIRILCKIKSNCNCVANLFSIQVDEWCLPFQTLEDYRNNLERIPPDVHLIPRDPTFLFRTRINRAKFLPAAIVYSFDLFSKNSKSLDKPRCHPETPKYNRSRFFSLTATMYLAMVSSLFAGSHNSHSHLRTHTPVENISANIHFIFTSHTAHSNSAIF